MIVVVLDTNVVVSGLLNPNGTPGKVVDLAMDNRIQVAYDDRVLGEYEDVLARPELHILPSRAKAVVDHIELSGKYVVAAPLAPQGFNDLDDIAFAEVFISSDADALITGNARHFKPLTDQNLPVYSPARFLETYFSEKLPPR